MKKALSEALVAGNRRTSSRRGLLSDEKMFSSVYGYLADARGSLDRASRRGGAKASRALFYLDDDAHVGDALAALAGRAA